jgi:uncharacterized protein YbjT (DUF2867 family)
LKKYTIGATRFERREAEEPMILVTGATGNVGGELLELLLDEGHRVRVLVRDPGKRAAIDARAEVAIGDLERPDTLAPAFAGIERAFVMCARGDLATMAGNAAEAARAAGIRHVVFLSSMAIDHEIETPIGRWHRDAEAKIAASGAAWTMLRPGGFASNTLRWAGTIKARGAVFEATGAGKTAPIDPLDIAAVAAKALTSAGHEGQVYTLTGPEALSAAEQVAIIGAAIGRRLEFVDVSPDAASRELAKAGMPERMIAALLAAWALVRAGHGTRVTTTVEQLLGRPARTFAAWAERHADAFR